MRTARGLVPVGGGAGSPIVDDDDPERLTAFLQPSMDPMSFGVRAITEIEYAGRIEEFRAIGGP